MAAPNPFQYLKHGAVLCGKTFASFVETFNFLVDFARNVRGDGENNASGIITFDRTVPDRPVIRSKVTMEMVGGGKAKLSPGCFEVRASSGGSGGQPYDAGGFDNCYYMVGSRLYEATSARTYGTMPPSVIVALRVNLTGSAPVANIATYATFGDLQSAADNDDYTFWPLYETNAAGGVAADLRNIPSLIAKEFAS